MPTSTMTARVDAGELTVIGGGGHVGIPLVLSFADAGFRVNVNDVNLAVASKALIVAFNVKTEADARRAAELQGVAIREYSVIYTLVEEIERAGTVEAATAALASRVKLLKGAAVAGMSRREPRA